MFDDAGGAGKPRIGQIALSYDPDEQVAVRRAMDQFRWFTGGWRVNAELPVPASFDAAATTVREQDVSAQMPCGPDLERHVAGIREFAAAGSRMWRWCRSARTPKSGSSPGRPNSCPPFGRHDHRARWIATLGLDNELILWLGRDVTFRRMFR
jgi:hypothetical protein